MPDLDDTDFEILRLLTEDARRSYSDIADVVDLSAPAVSDRVSRLRDLGVVQRFTVDVDHGQLRGGVPVLVTLDLDPGTVEAARQRLLGAEAVEHVFATAEAAVVFQARVPDGDVRSWLDDRLDLSTVRGYEVDLLASVDWSPSVEGSEFAVDCAECGNTVTSEGVSARIAGDRYEFCCSSCESRFAQKYDALQES